MTRHFSIPLVLRMVPKGLLRKFFAQMGHEFLEVPWEKIRPHEIETILAGLHRLPTAEQLTIETALQNVFELACENGRRAICEAKVEIQKQNRLMYYPDLASTYAMSVWIWLHYPQIFDRAMLLYEVDQLGRWRKRKDLPRRAPNTTGEALLNLANAISRLLKRQEGRGQCCTVEYVHRGDGSECFLAYPDDFVHTILMHDVAGNLAPRSIRPAFEMVFAFTPAEGVLEINAKVPSRLKAELEDIFCETILGETAEERRLQAIYNLNVLKEGIDRLETDPEDGVSPIIHRLRLAIPECRDTITFEADRAGSPDRVYQMLDDYLNREHLPLAVVDVASATIGMVLESRENRRPGRMTFDVARPDSCTLRNHRPERVALAQKYLKRWGIALG
jgi:hypothetical protein